jgi:hypothetical protein
MLSIYRDTQTRLPAMNAPLPPDTRSQCPYSTMHTTQTTSHHLRLSSTTSLPQSVYLPLSSTHITFTVPNEISRAHYCPTNPTYL